jgi:hypothetical protein
MKKLTNKIIRQMMYEDMNKRIQHMNMSEIEPASQRRLDRVMKTLASGKGQKLVM